MPFPLSALCSADLWEKQKLVQQICAFNRFIITLFLYGVFYVIAQNDVINPHRKYLFLCSLMSDV